MRPSPRTPVRAFNSEAARAASAGVVRATSARRLVLYAINTPARFSNGVTSNFGALQRFYRAVDAIWRKWLSRWSQRGAISWVRWHALRKVFVLPLPSIEHRYAT